MPQSGCDGVSNQQNSGTLILSKDTLDTFTKKEDRQSCTQTRQTGTLLWREDLCFGRVTANSTLLWLDTTRTALLFHESSQEAFLALRTAVTNCHVAPNKRFGRIFLD
jgi:hypothetical protein